MNPLTTDRGEGGWEMNPPDYREAACCFNCWHRTTMGSRCSKHGGKIDDLYVCADFCRPEDMEGEQ